MISLLIILVVVGFVLYLFNTFVEAIDPKVKRLINIVVIFLLVLMVVFFFLDLFGVYNSGVMNKLKG